MIFSYLFFIFKFVTYLLFNKIMQLITAKSKFSKKLKIAVLRTDNIGDYIIFRNFLNVLKKNFHLDRIEITLIGNEVFKDLALEFDKKSVDKFIWINRNYFLKNPIYRIKKLYELRDNSYDFLLNPIYSRDFFISDWISNWIIAKVKYAFEGDTLMQSQYQKKISNKWYDYLLKVEHNLFEFKKNKFFFEFFLKKKIKLKKTNFKKINKKKNIINFKNYVCFFIDAGKKNKIYSLQKYKEIINFIINNTNLKVLVFRKKRTDVFEKNKNILCLLNNKTPLNKVVHIIRRSKLLISNDTFAYHLAAALNTKCIVISNGDFYDRFLNYPKGMYPNGHIIVHPLFNKNDKNKNTLTFMNINTIETRNVINKVKKIISFNN